jgi:hypothetical protein
MTEARFIWVIVVVAILCIIVVVAFAVDRSTSNSRRVRIEGVKMVAHMHWNERAYSYDCTGHGHFIHVHMKGGQLITDGDPNNDFLTRKASPDEEREWNRFFA